MEFYSRLKMSVDLQLSVGTNLVNRVTQISLAIVAMALVLTYPEAEYSFGGVAAVDGLVGTACLDRVGLGSCRRRPTLGPGCGNDKHSAVSCVIGRKRPTLSFGRAELQGLQWPWGWCHLISEVIDTHVFLTHQMVSALELAS